MKEVTAFKKLSLWIRNKRDARFKKRLERVLGDNWIEANLKVDGSVYATGNSSACIPRVDNTQCPSIFNTGDISAHGKGSVSLGNGNSQTITACGKLKQ